MTGRMSVILAQTSKARLGKNSRTSSLIVFESLVQENVSRPSESSWELCSSAWAPRLGGEPYFGRQSISLRWEVLA